MKRIAANCRKRFFLFTILLFLLLFFSHITYADDWPTGPITIVVPTGPGSSVDRLTRGFAPFLADEIGVSVVVDNRAGGAFTVGIRHLIRQPADGYYLFSFPEPYFTFARQKVEGVERTEDWAFIGAVHTDASAVMAYPGRFHSIDEVVEELKAEERLTFGTLHGCPALMGFFAFTSALDLPSPEYIWYADGGELRVDLIGGHIHLSTATLEGFFDLHEAGEGNLVISFTEERGDPGIPTAREIVEKYGGDPDEVPILAYVRFLAATAEFKTEYPERYEKLVTALRNVAHNEEFINWGIEAGMEPEWVEPETVSAISRAIEELVEEYPEAVAN